MKRLSYSILSVLLVCLLGTSCVSKYSYPYYGMPVKQSDGTFCFVHDIKTVEDLTKHGRVIVQGYIEDDAKEIAPMGTRYTVSNLKITKVYKGDYQVGDTIQLYERFYVEERDGADTLITFQNYMPCEAGKEYLFFMDGFTGYDDIYTPMMFKFGRYPVVNSYNCRTVDVDTLSVEDLYLCNDYQEYRDIYKEVIDEYMK